MKLRYKPGGGIDTALGVTIAAIVFVALFLGFMAWCQSLGG